MKAKGWISIVAATCLLLIVGCEKDAEPDLSGIITLSSQLHGTGPYYLYGFSFEEGKLSRPEAEIESLIRTRMISRIAEAGGSLVEEERELTYKVSGEKLLNL